jgi:hypothetical protein
LLISRITAQHDLIGEENIQNVWKLQSLLFISTNELVSRIDCLLLIKLMPLAFQSAKVLLTNSAFSSKNISSNMLQLYFGVGRFMPSEMQIQSAKLQETGKKLNKVDIML